MKGLQTTFCRQITFWCGQDLGGGHPHVALVDGLFVTNDARSLERRCLDGNLPFIADRAM